MALKTGIPASAGDPGFHRVKRRYQWIAGGTALLMAVSAMLALRVAAGLNYDIDNFSWAGTFRSRSGKTHRSIRELHHWLDEHFSDEAVTVFLLLLWLVAIACFIALPVLLLRWQRVRERFGRTDPGGI